MDLAADILQSGKVLYRYRIDHKLGGGGMGDVYKATDLELERPVALKVLSRPAAQNAATKGQLLREARLACSLTHSNIVTIHAIERAEGVEFIVMEYVQGETLRDLLREGPLELDQLLDIGADIADALAAAHEIGLLHRDIKPANIMITPKGRAKVLDFGLAKRLPAGESTLDTLSQSTTENVVKGTIPYMSPEQTRAEPLDARSDIFSLGSVLYECATGERPFPGSEAHAIMRAIVSHDPPPASRLRPDLHAGLDLVLATAMAKDRSNRMATALEFSKALRSLRRGQPPETGRVIKSSAPTSDLPNNLPPQLTSFIGREREVAQIKRLFGSSRLITLTGSGGCGKTRLALRVAQDLLAECADGVWFVDLAPLSDPDLLPQTVASTLSIREEAGKSFKETLADHLIGKSLLLILDNCEHLVSASAMLTRDLLHECPGIHILVTSREPLQIAGEAVWRTPSLSVPSETDDLQRLRDSEAVQLFLARAEAAHSHFTLGKQNAPVVGQICRRLDGIPLAIELAAARAGGLAPQEILSRLEDRFRLLGRDTLGVIPRQRTLRATIDWSYELLSTQEQQLFQRLGVFAASFALEAAESVCAGGGVETTELVHIVTRLFEKSLISAEEDSAGGGRYRLPETLRAYARERLRAAKEEDPIRRSHRDYFLSVAESAERELQGPDQARWFNRLDADNEDIRVAIQNALDGGDASIASRFCGSLWRFWWVRGMWSEGRGKIQGALTLSDGGVPPAAHLKLVHGGAVLARGQGAYGEAESLLQGGLDLARANSDPRGVATIQHELGNIANERGDLPKARSLYESSLAQWRKLEDKRGISSAVHNLGVVAQSQRDYKAAQRLYQESLGIQRELGNRAWEAAGLNGLGSVALAQGQLPVARSCHEEALSIQKDLGDRWGMAFSLRELGLVAERTGELKGAQGLLEESLRILRDLGDREGIAESLEGLVALAVAQAQPDRALRLAGAAWALRAAIGSPLMPGDRERLEGSVREAKQALRKEAASQAYADGRGLSINQAVRYALQEEPDSTLAPSAR